MSKSPVHPKIQVVAACLERSHFETGQTEILILRRSPHVRNPGEWEFPGGKIDANESAKEALHREIAEELNLKIKIYESLGEVTFTKKENDFTLEVFRSEIIGGELKLTEHDSYQWIVPQDLEIAMLSAPDQPFIERWLQAYEKESR